MIIEKLSSKYKVGCGRGIGIDIPDLVFKLNLIIDKKNSAWPEEDGEHELAEGDVFVIDGQVFAVDKDRLVLVISETGPKAHERILKEVIEPEFEFSCFEDPDNDYAWEITKETTGLTEYTPPYSWMKIWQEKFLRDQNFTKEIKIKATITDSMLGLSRSMVLSGFKIYYSEADFTEDERDYFLKKLMSWFYSVA